MHPSSPLVLSKFSPPRIAPAIVPREALLMRLHPARLGRLVLIDAGAGFGKTTLMAQWRQALLKEARVTWFSLTVEDAGFEQFCADLLGSLEPLALGLDADLLLLGAPTSPLAEGSLATILVNAFARARGELYLMLDDFHHVTDPAITRFLQALLDLAPANLHLVIASRNTPDLKLGRLRAMGELHVVEGEDLAFEFHESLAFLKRFLDAGIALDTAHALHALTDGWPIGLQLASIALKGKPNPRDDLRLALAAGAELGAYLSEDVVAHLPARLLAFMQQLAVLRRFNAELASRVTGYPDAIDLLAHIEAQNLFLQPVELHAEDQWYRFHPMFAEFLLQRLYKSDVALADLHHRAAAWLAGRGLVDEAMHHAIQSTDCTLVMALLEGALAPGLGLGHMAAFQRWMRQLPHELLTGQPQLLLHGIWSSVMSARTGQAESWLEHMQQIPAADRFRSQIALARGVIALQHDDYETALGNLPLIASRELSTPLLNHLHMALRLSCLTMQGHHQEAHAVFNAPQGRITRSGDDDSALLARNMISMVMMHQGNVPEALRIGMHHLEQAEARHGRRSITACACAALVADALYELNALGKARETLANRLDLLHLSTINVTLRAVTCQGRLLWLQDPRAASTYLARMQAQFHERGLDRGVAVVLALQVQQALAGNDERQAQHLQAQLQALASRHTHASIRGAEIIILATLTTARLSLCSGESEQCLQALLTCEHLVTTLQRPLLQVRVQLLRALALRALDQQEAASACLAAALAAGYRHGLVRTFLDEGERLRSALEALGEQHPQSLETYRRSLIEKPAHPPEPAAPAAHRSPLTPREQQILELLQQSMSNKRIALALDISAQTVKWNLSNIFSKLNVGSRYEACQAALRLAERVGH